MISTMAVNRVERAQEVCEKLRDHYALSAGEVADFEVILVRTGVLLKKRSWSGRIRLPRERG